MDDFSQVSAVGTRADDVLLVFFVRNGNVFFFRGARLRKGGVHIQLVIGNDEKMVPEFPPIVDGFTFFLNLSVADVSVGGSCERHRFDDCFRRLVSFLAVLNLDRIFNHFLDIPSVLSDNEFVTRCVVF